MSKCHVCGGTKEFEGVCIEDDNMSELKPCPFKKCDWYDRDLECTLYYKRDYENCTVKKLESKLKAAEDRVGELDKGLQYCSGVLMGCHTVLKNATIPEALYRVAELLPDKADKIKALLEGKE